jgi:hypothetical protein
VSEINVARYADVVWALSQVTPAAFEKDWPNYPGHCILGTRVGLGVLRYFGIEAKPVAVGAAFYNPIAAKALEEGVRGMDLYRTVPGAWAVGVGAKPDDPDQPGHWNGHLIIETAEHLIDLNSDQASRPERQMPVPAALVLRKPPEWTSGEKMAWSLDEGVVGIYWLVDDQRWRQAPDWRGDDRHKRTTGKVIRAVRNLLRAMPHPQG